MVIKHIGTPNVHFLKTKTNNFSVVIRSVIAVTSHDYDTQDRTELWRASGKPNQTFRVPSFSLGLGLILEGKFLIW